MGVGVFNKILATGTWNCDSVSCPAVAASATQPWPPRLLLRAPTHVAAIP